MWKNCSPAEILERRRIARRKRIQTALVFALLGCGFVTFIRSASAIVRNHGEILAWGSDALDRLPLGIGAGILIGFLIYRIRPKRALICPQCEHVGTDDGSGLCSCGCEFKDIDEMKWVEEITEPGARPNAAEPPPQSETPPQA